MPLACDPATENWPDPPRSLDVLAARQVAAIQGHGGGAGAGQRQQLGGVAAVQRQVDHALLLIDDLRHGVLLGFHHGRIGFHLDAFGYRAELHRHINRDVGRHLQNDAGLHVGLKTFRRHFQPVVTNRQVRHRIAAGSIGHGVADLTLIHFGRFHLSARDSLAARVGDVSIEFRDGHRLRSGARSECS